MLQAIIFDVDGTLSETEEIHRNAFNDAFRKKGLAWHWDQSTYRQLLQVSGGKERIRHFAEQQASDFLRTPDIDTRIRDIHKTKTVNYTHLIANGEATLRPGIRSLIGEAARNSIRLAIATTTSLPNVEALLQSAYGEDGVGIFEVICCGDSVPKKKPAPDIYLLALEQLGLRGEACVAIEDSRNGILSSTCAGIPTVVTPSAYTDDQNFDEAALVTDAISFASIEKVCASHNSVTKAAYRQ